MKKSLMVIGLFGVIMAMATAHGRPSMGPQLSSPAQANLGRDATAINSPGSRPAVARDFGNIPVYFVPNGGQMDSPVEFTIQSRDKTIYFTPDGVTYALPWRENGANEEISKSKARHEHRFGQEKGRTARERESQRWIVKMDFVGETAGVKPQGVSPTGAMISYFQGRPEEWKAGLPAYSGIIYRDLWPGIDLVYKGLKNKLKYEFIVHPGADPRSIELAWRGAEAIRVDGDGRLEIKTPAGDFIDEPPMAYQEIEGRRVEVAMRYDLSSSDSARGGEDGSRTISSSCRFAVGAYDRTKDLVLDPADILYCGFVGGSGAESAEDIAVDGSGNAYITGYTDSSSATFPVAVGPAVTAIGNVDAFVAKVNAAGTALVYCGYIGGYWDDFGEGIAVDGSGNAYIAGYTASDETTFPAISGPDLTYNGNMDAFVAKVNAAGTALVYSGYIGGFGPDFGESIAVDGSGNAYLAGYTESDQTTFPETAGPDLTYNGQVDAFVAKVNASGAALTYCGYIGGSSADSLYGIAVDSSGNAYVGGFTSSDETSFPETVGPDLTYNFQIDAFVAKVNASGTALTYCGYIGGSSADYLYGIAVDSAGSAYVVGFTSSTEATFPVAVGPDLTQNGSTDIFVAKVAPSGAALAYCGYIGGNNWEEEYPCGIAVDGSGNAYVTGTTNSDETSFPVMVGPILTFVGDADSFVAKVAAGGAALVYCGYLGGGGGDYGHGIAVDASRNAYVAGMTTSEGNIFINPGIAARRSKNSSVPRTTVPGGTDFPVIVGPDLTHNGGRDAFVAKIAAYGAAGGADISVEKTTDNLAPLVGETFHFTVTATNLGPDDATGLEVTDALPAGLTLISSTASQGTYASGTGIWDIGSLANGDTATLTLTVKGTTSGTVTNTAAVSALNESDPEAANDSDSVSVAIGEETAYTLTIVAGAGGTTSPAPGTYTYAPGTVVSIQALPAAGYRFGNWSGDASGSANPVAITMNGNKSVTANFVRRYTLTITAGTGGTTSPAPGTYTYDEGASVTIRAIPAAGYRFGSWSGDASGSGDSVAITMNRNKAVSASFIRQVTLTIVAGAGGTTSPSPGTYIYDEGASAVVQAIPAAAFRFENWSGDASGSANPVTVVMTADKTIQANFSKAIKPPLGLTAEKLTNRNVSMIEYLVRLRWQPNGANAGVTGYRIYQIENGVPTMIGEVGVATFEYLVRNLEQNKTYQFGVTAVDGQGWESDMAVVTVQ